MKQVLLIFAKNPVYGKVKTRLAATIGNNAAFAVYTKLLQHTVSITTDLPVSKIVFYSNHIEQDDLWNNTFFQKQLQNGVDLGEKMCQAFAHAFANGYDKAVIIGTDCMELESAIIMAAFENLNKYDVVIGPAKDGGYYLLGMQKLHRELFENIAWSTNAVLQKTIDVCNQLGLSVFCLKELSDVDEEKDLIATNLMNP